MRLPRRPKPPQLPQRTPDLRKARLDRLDAVLATCLVDPGYTRGRLAPYEDELTDLLELGLELDDQWNPGDIG